MLGSTLLRCGLAALFALAAAPAPAADRVLVLTSLQPTYSIAHALAKGTAIDVQQAFPADIGMDQQSPYLARRRREDFIAAAQKAAAVVTIRKTWESDPLFPAVRRVNIRAIEIDASSPLSPELAGVALLPAGKDGANGAVSPYIWLNPTNAIRMTDIVAADLRRLSEADAKTIDANQVAFRQRILALKTEFEAKLAELDDPSVILLSPELGYLTGGLGVDVAATFTKPGFDWNDADAAALADKIAASGVRGVIAMAKPKDAVAAAIAKAGGRLAVLDPIDPGLAGADGKTDPDGFVMALRANFERLLTAMKP